MRPGIGNPMLVSSEAPMSRSASAFLALSTVLLLSLTGCGAGTSFSNPSTSVGFKGKVFGGQQPVANAAITVWEVGSATYGSAATSLATTTSGADGTFSFSDGSYTCSAGEQVYITASGGNSASLAYTNPNIMLVTGLGDCAAAQSATVEINEVTTVATAFALAQFFTPALGTTSTDSFGTPGADLGAFTNSNQYTIPMLIDIPTGTVNPNNATTTIEAAKIYTIANILAACVNDAADFTNCNTLYQNTTLPGLGNPVPSDTLQAAVQMSRYPYLNVSNLFQLASSKPPFIGLATPPNDWTVGVSYTTSDYALGVVGGAASNAVPGVLSATSATIDIDAGGYIWFPSNLTSKVGIAYFDPTLMTFNGPYVSKLTSTVTSPFVQPQYVAIDSLGLVWASDVSYSTIGYTDTALPGGIFTASSAVAPGVTLGPIAADASSNVYVAVDDLASGPYLESVGGTFTPDGLLDDMPTGLLSSGFATTSATGAACDIEIIAGDTPYVLVTTSNSGTCVSGGIVSTVTDSELLSTATSLNEICRGIAGTCSTLPAPYDKALNLPEGIATDGAGNEWIANSGNASVYLMGGTYSGYSPLSPVDYVHDAANGNTMTTPYAIAIDGSGNVWIANASCVTTTSSFCTPGPFVLSELIGAAGPTITPLSAQMIYDGALVGMPPGTVAVPPPSNGSAHPHAGASASVRRTKENTASFLLKR